MAPRARTCVCDTCGSAHYNPDDLTAHMITHHGQQGLVCPKTGCGKGFASPRALRRHQKAHDEGFAHPCTWCDFISARRDNLKRHERTCENRGGPVAPAAPAVLTVLAAPVVPAAPAAPAAPAILVAPVAPFLPLPPFAPAAPAAPAPIPAAGMFYPANHTTQWEQLWWAAIAYGAGDLRMERNKLAQSIFELFQQGKLDGPTTDGWLSRTEMMEEMDSGPSVMMIYGW